MPEGCRSCLQRSKRQERIAPAFDFGSCLLPQADDDTMRRVIEDKAECDARIYTFPASALKENGRKINCVNFVRRDYIEGETGGH